MKFLRRITYLWRLRRMQAELAEELEFHRTQKEEAFQSQGMPAEDARSAAQRELGNMTSAREEARGVRLSQWIETSLQDLSYAVRALTRAPGFALLVLGILGVSIGVNTSLFTVFNSVAFRPWPVHDPARVVTVFKRSIVDQRTSVSGLSLPEYRHLQANAKTFSGLPPSGACRCGSERKPPAAGRSDTTSAATTSMY